MSVPLCANGTTILKLTAEDFTLMRLIVLLVCSMLLQAPASGTIAEVTPKPALTKVHKIAIGGEGGWDYLSVDSDARV